VLAVHKRANLELRRKDFDILLARTGWLNDNIINFYMEILRDAGMAGTRRRFCFLPFWAHHTIHQQKAQKAVTEKLLRYHNRTMRRPADDKRIALCLQNTDAFAFVVNARGTHWNTAVIDIGKRLVGRYDSRGWGHDTSYYDDIVRNTQVALQAIATAQQDSFDNRADLHQLASYEPKKPTHFSGDQKNGSDCGVHALATLDWLTDGIAPYPTGDYRVCYDADDARDYVNRVDPVNLRKRFALEMLKGQLLRTTMSPTRRPAPQGKPEETHAPKVLKTIL
jgi:Ulp1 family protease